MKIFVPGQIALAKDVNDNFAEAKKAGTDAHAALNELLASLTPKTVACAPTSGWRASGSLSAVITSGRHHVLPFTIARNRGQGFRTTDGGTFNVLTVPSGVAVPSNDWTNVGIIQMGSYSAPLVYRAGSRTIAVHPTSVFEFPADTWAYGHASWIA